MKLKTPPETNKTRVLSSYVAAISCASNRSLFCFEFGFKFPLIKLKTTTTTSSLGPNERRKSDTRRGWRLLRARRRLQRSVAWDRKELRSSLKTKSFPRGNSLWYVLISEKQLIPHTNSLTGKARGQAWEDLLATALAWLCFVTPWQSYRCKEIISNDVNAGKKCDPDELRTWLVSKWSSVFQRKWH